MPYIKQEDRKRIDIHGRFPSNEGELNYLITRLVKQYWDEDPRYRTIADITGVLENVKQEFYRRIAVPYEDKKIEENGDVYV
jgi:hypothetical protein